ncbi:MAG: glucoamylase family protein [Chloroflexota bacterium]
MPNLVVPETSWGPTSFGLADLKYARVQLKYATEELKYSVWGLSCSSTADDSGDYACYGAMGALFPTGQQLAICGACNPETTVSPHASVIALDVLPQQAFANIQALRTLYPGVYGAQGFYDALNPTTGAVGHRILVLDQSLIMAALDNALENRAMQGHFAKDPVSWAAQTYLSYETLDIVK